MEQAEKLVQSGNAADAAVLAQTNGDVWVAARALLMAQQPLRAHAQLVGEQSRDACVFRARCLNDVALGEQALAELDTALSLPSTSDDDPRRCEAELNALKGRAHEELGSRQQAAQLHENALLVNNLQLDSLRAVFNRKLMSRARLHNILQNPLARALAGLGIHPSLSASSARQCAPVRAAEAARLLDHGDPESALQEVRGLELEPGDGCAEALSALASLSRSHELLRIAHRLSASSAFAPAVTSLPPSSSSSSAEAAAAAATAALATTQQQQQQQQQQQHQAAATPVPASSTAALAPIACLPAYAAGCQHLANGQLDAGRRWFSRACSRGFPAAWLGFAHALAEQEEHDQALAAYRAAMRAFPEWHAPMMYLGTEHLAQSSAEAALHFLQQARERAPDDWQVYAELGAAYYATANQDDLSESCLREALYRLPSGISTMKNAEILHANLGHALRRLGKIQEAISELHKALSTSEGRRCASTHTALGLCYIQLGAFSTAVESLHTSLSIRPSDSVASELLDAALLRASQNENLRAEQLLNNY